MNNHKIKLSLLDDYVELTKILIFCKNADFTAEIANLSETAQVVMLAYDKIFVALKMNDCSLLVFKQEINYCLANFKFYKTENGQNLINKNFETLNKIKTNLKQKLKKLSCPLPV